MIKSHYLKFEVYFFTFGLKITEISTYLLINLIP